MNGFYFVDTRVTNGRAHSIQALKTVEHVNSETCTLRVVAPRYESVNTTQLFTDLHITTPFAITTLFNFGFQTFGRIQILLYVCSASGYFLYHRFRRTVDFIYFRNDRLLLVAFFAYITKTPFYFEIHRQPKTRIETLVRNWLIKRARGVTVITPLLYDQYQSAVKNISLLECGVDTDLFVAAEPQHKQIVLGYSGSLQAHHGIRDVLESLATMEHGPQIRILGGTQQQIDDLAPLYAKAQFVGKVPYVAVAREMQKTDILLLPQKRGDAGAVSSKMYEYFALGKPIIASAIPANTAAMKVDQQARFFTVGDRQEFIQAVTELINDETVRTRVGTYNRKEAKKFSFKKRGEKLRTFIKKTLT